CGPGSGVARSFRIVTPSFRIVTPRARCAAAAPAGCWPQPTTGRKDNGPPSPLYRYGAQGTCFKTRLLPYTCRPKPKPRTWEPRTMRLLLPGNGAPRGGVEPQVGTHAAVAASWRGGGVPRVGGYRRAAAGRRHAAGGDLSVAISSHAVVIAGGGPTGLMLAGELALAGIDVAIVERRHNQALAGSRAGGLHARTIEVLDQRGIADRFLSQGQVAQVAQFARAPLDISDFPTRHNYRLGLWQSHIQRILAGWVDELAVPIYRGREVTGFAQDNTGVDVAVSDGQFVRTDYLVGCDGGRSVIRKAAGIAFPGWDPTTSNLIAEVEMAEEPEWGMRHDALGIHGLSRLEAGGQVRVVVTERQLGPSSEPTLRDLSEALIAVYGTDYGIHNPSWI